ncbi:Uncharacterised protein [Vibrio cholerae]|nr:Uncharacterised protein [Vibrio cholerae]
MSGVIEGFINQRVRKRPKVVSVASLLATFGLKGHHVAAVRGDTLNRHKRHCRFFHARIKLQAVAVNDVDHLHHQAVFIFVRIVNCHRFARVLINQQVMNTRANAGDINAKVSHIEAFKHFADLRSLMLERKPAPSVFLKYTEFLNRHNRWRDHHQHRIITGS